MKKETLSGAIARSSPFIQASIMQGVQGMDQAENMEALLDFLYQAMFTITSKGYSPKEVDMFIEELKDECRAWNEKYLELQRELQEMKERCKGVDDAGREAGD